MEQPLGHIASPAGTDAVQDAGSGHAREQDETHLVGRSVEHESPVPILPTSPAKPAGRVSLPTVDRLRPVHDSDADRLGALPVTHAEVRSGHNAASASDGLDPNESVVCG
jgi:hypothetical protein